MSFDDSIRPRKHAGWDRQTNLFGRFEIDHQLELRRLLDRQIGSLSALQDFIHVRGDAPVDVRPFAP